MSGSFRIRIGPIQTGVAGLWGRAIEEPTGDPDTPIYDFELSVDRIQATVEAKPSKDFSTTARAENFINGPPILAKRSDA
ncbi:hypothetical protein [uncultured Roseobacter sp.]|uniref:hypothetical protein n=1 Tax=uncultured Roseobacter sp. TaxID=114847 RepID=UPI002616D797|nr:hypothetical protein [uncultured Roseobacter sp.]